MGFENEHDAGNMGFGNERDAGNMGFEKHEHDAWFQGHQPQVTTVP